MRLFSGLGMGRLMSVIRPQMRLAFEWLVPWVVLLGCRLLEVVVLLVLSLALGPCRSRRLSLHSLYIHSFSITGGPWFLQLSRGC